MDPKQQDKSAETPVISPLANEKTYGERQYTRIFDWGLNYWTNLLASAGFSQWAEHSTKPFKIPLLMKEAHSPRDLQQSLANGVRRRDPFFKFFERGIREEMVGQAEHVIETAIHDRSMARARSLTLLMPGFIVMIPSVWLGAKFKPAIVEWFNKRHYGEEAMDDPSLKARHQAIEAEARPTLIGTIIGRFGTVGAVQIAAQLFGSDKNLIQKHMGVKNFRGIDPFTERLGSSLGGAFPEGARNRFNTRAQSWGYDWSLAQRKDAALTKLPIDGAYSNAAQDLGRFIVADTVYTAISAGTIRPIMKWLPRMPVVGSFFSRIMSYTPKSAANTPTLDGDKIKVPANRYADSAPIPAANDPIVGELSRAEPAANDEKFNTEAPTHKVHSVNNHTKMAETTEQKRAQG